MKNRSRHLKKYKANEPIAVVFRNASFIVHFYQTFIWHYSFIDEIFPAVIIVTHYIFLDILFYFLLSFFPSFSKQTGCVEEMVTWSFAAALRAAVLLLAANGAVATPGFKTSTSPSYSSVDVCPERRSVSGPSTGNWSVYPDFRKIKKCKQTMFYNFNLYDPVDDRAPGHKIYACSSFGPDLLRIPASNARVASGKAIDVEFEVGWWQEEFGVATSGLRSHVKQIRHCADNGHGATDRPFII
jgi:hypothetical protein